MLPRSSVKKVLIVTGGSRGIGAAVARLAAQNGYAVCLSYLNNRDAANDVVASIAAKGGVALAVQADVAVEQDVVRLFEQVDASLGSKGAIDTSSLAGKGAGRGGYPRQCRQSRNYSYQRR